MTIFFARLLDASLSNFHIKNATKNAPVGVKNVSAVISPGTTEPISTIFGPQPSFTMQMMRQTGFWATLIFSGSWFAKVWFFGRF